MIENSEFNSVSNSPNSAKKLASQRERLANVWDEDSPQLVDFTLKSSPIKNRISPSKFQEPPQEDSDSKSKRRRTEYVVMKNSKDWNQEFYFSLDPLDTLIKFK